MKTNIDNRGQIGPTSLEDIFPMAIAFIMTFILIAAVYTITAGHLEARRTEAAQKISRETALLMETKSQLVYGNEKGLLDANKIKSYSYEELNASYAVTGYCFSAGIVDLVTGEKWAYEPDETDHNTFSTATPIAIRYSEDAIHEGLLSVRVWRN